MGQGEGARGWRGAGQGGAIGVGQGEWNLYILMKTSTKQLSLH